MDKSQIILELVRKKTKRVTLMLNPKLWEMVTQTAKEDDKLPTNIIEELVIDWLNAKGKIKE
ncbi:MAG: hypothetical protein HRT90_01205 [Candidatus Margulisbacteria bacterium]|nr:hypothetical protein [Candidatus Margulisiibacteriota bacterium]